MMHIESNLRQQRWLLYPLTVWLVFCWIAFSKAGWRESLFEVGVGVLVTVILGYFAFRSTYFHTSAVVKDSYSALANEMLLTEDYLVFIDERYQTAYTSLGSLSEVETKQWDELRDILDTLQMLRAETRYDRNEDGDLRIRWTRRNTKLFLRMCKLILLDLDINRVFPGPKAP
jgi:hypothetical protein